MLITINMLQQTPVRSIDFSIHEQTSNVDGLESNKSGPRLKTSQQCILFSELTLICAKQLPTRVMNSKTQGWAHRTIFLNVCWHWEQLRSWSMWSSRDSRHWFVVGDIIYTALEGSEEYSRWRAWKPDALAISSNPVHKKRKCPLY